MVYHSGVSGFVTGKPNLGDGGVCLVAIRLAPLPQQWPKPAYNMSALVRWKYRALYRIRLTLRSYLEQFTGISAPVGFRPLHNRHLRMDRLSVELV